MTQSTKIPVSSEAVDSVDILDFDREELENFLVEEFGEKPFRSRQILEWVYQRRVRNFEEMSNISKNSRADFIQRFTIYRPKITKWQESKDGTIKFLIEVENGALVEAVLICQPRRYTLCISSQVGCAIGCTFCRTALMGLKRNLATREILGQVMAVVDFIDSPPDSVETKPQQFKNIVFMGMGEPLHNSENVFRTARILCDPYALALSYKRVTISTSGLVKQITAMADQQIPASLAISLNATTDEVRSKLIPINKKWPIEKLLETLDYYTKTTRREVTLEYVMLAGVNDSDADLKRLASISNKLPSKINLIPYNSNSGLGFRSPEKAKIINWQNRLCDLGLNARVRWSKGEDIDAACGQLATDSEKALA